MANPEWMDNNDTPTPEQVEAALRAAWAKIEQYSRYPEVGGIQSYLMKEHPWIWNYLRR